MQKKLIALAVAGLASSATFAQSSTSTVTVYGIVDMAYVGSTASNSPSQTQGIDSGGWSSSRLGFRGSEDLGDGLKAIFTLEYGLNPDINSGTTSARQTFVGVTSSSWGTIRSGRLNSLGKDASDAYDAMSMTTFSPLYSMQKGNGLAATAPGATGTYALFTSGRLSNAVDFKSTNMAGFVFGVQYAFAPNFGDNTAYNTVARPNQESIFQAGVEYKAGPFGVNTVYSRARAIGNTNNNYKADELFIGGAYDFGMAKVLATWQTHKRNLTPTALTLNNPRQNEKDTLWSVGLQAPVTAANKIYAGFAQATDGSAFGNDSNSWGVQGTHDLSKRTMLYAGYQIVMNDNGAATKALPNTSGSATVVPGQDTTGFGLGVRHTF